MFNHLAGTKVDNEFFAFNRFCVTPPYSNKQWVNNRNQESITREVKKKDIDLKFGGLPYIMSSSGWGYQKLRYITVYSRVAKLLCTTR